MAMRPRGILETCIYASDLAQAEAFYRDVLGLEFIARQVGRHVFFRCGQFMLLIFDPCQSSLSTADVPHHGAEGPSHLAFDIPEGEFEAWRQHLAGAGVSIEKAISWPQGGRSIYFRDPAGNSVELATASIWENLSSGSA